jgi:hypothetical protein
MLEVSEIVVYWAITITSVALILRWDERRLTPEQRARAWPPATRLGVIGFSFLTGPLWGALCVPVHFWRTRRTFLGTLAGFGLGTLVFALDIGAVILLELAFGED